MGIFSADIRTMDDLFLHGLQDIYYAEQQIVKALPNTTNLNEEKAANTKFNTVALRKGVNAKAAG